jgi:hypothetical protein
LPAAHFAQKQSEHGSGSMLAQRSHDLRFTIYESLLLLVEDRQSGGMRRC